jgi:hypothetical protein
VLRVGTQHFTGSGRKRSTEFPERLGRGTKIVEHGTLLKKGFSTVGTKLIHVPGTSDENENDNLRFSEIIFKFFSIFMPKRK